MAVAVLLGGDALEIMHVALAHPHRALGASGKLVVVALVGIGAEGHLVGVVAVAQRDGLAGDGGKAVIVSVAAVVDYPYTALNLVQMELHGAVSIIIHLYHLFGVLRAAMRTLYTMPQGDIP